MAVDKLFKIYGYIEDKIVVLNQIKKVLDSYLIEEIEISNNRLDFFYWDNIYIDFTAFLEELKKYFTNDTKGQIDYIDYEEWKMLRTEIKGKSLKQYPIYIDKALENCILE